jgi:hypothetical protein
LSSTTALLIDADDTLWRNNIYFEQVREQFLQWMEQLGFHSGEVQSLSQRLNMATFRRMATAGKI